MWYLKKCPTLEIAALVVILHFFTSAMAFSEENQLAAVVWTSVDVPAASARPTSLDGGIAVSLPSVSIKVGPATLFHSVGPWSRSAWFAQLLTNPADATKRREFYIYDLSKVSIEILVSLAKDIKSEGESGKELPRAAFLGANPIAGSAALGIPIKWNGELLWILAEVAGVGDPTEIWKAANLDKASLPKFAEKHSAAFPKPEMQANPLVAGEVSEMIVTALREVSTTPINCLFCVSEEQPSKYTYENKVEFKDFGTAARTFSAAEALPYIAFDREMPSLENLKVTSMINDPIMLPKGAKVSWPIDKSELSELGYGVARFCVYVDTQSKSCPTK